MVLLLRTWKEQRHADIFALIKSHLGVMEPAASCLAGFFMAFLLLQITVLTQAMSLDIQINIQVPDEEGVLVECTSGSLIPPAEMTWRDSKGNIIPHSSKFDSQDGLLYLKSSILLKNRTHGPVTCSIYNVTTNQEKKRSIVLPDVLFKPEYMSLMAKRPSCPVIYLIIILVLYCLRGILVCCLKWKTCEFMRGSNKMKLCYEFMWECLPLVLYIGFLPLYLNFRSRASILDNAYPLYSNWLWDVCIILVVMMLFFTGLILLLFVTLNTKEQKALCQPPEDEILPLYQLSQEFTEQRSPSPFLRDCREETAQLQGSIVEEIFNQPQGSCEEEIFNPLQPLRLNCSLNSGT
ncbi:selection and upkeep of intraepithelial T-cells protein 10-like [Peromyscus californicus insignis]|uniref:selection and upkeep of intraepithelial T-cells protein 10-like n=1 Tax=Peromyscus californicus insignis TaxID=564181 RepID=UPI0022A7FB44|nr:selection and upkeep of intraepithelial T-cells protein 10-like [Peromyscus californicus insignis]